MVGEISYSLIVSHFFLHVQEIRICLVARIMNIAAVFVLYHTDLVSE
jgi:hypothetical protein